MQHELNANTRPPRRRLFVTFIKYTCLGFVLNLSFVILSLKYNISIFKETRFGISYGTLLAILIIFVIDIRRNRIAPTISFVLGTLLIVPALLFYLFLWPDIQAYALRTDFDSQTWKQYDWRHDDKTRYNMSAKLIESNTLEGKTENEIQELLGEPLSVRTMKDGTLEYVYDVGYGYGLQIDPYILSIEFRDGKAVSVGMRET